MFGWQVLAEVNEALRAKTEECAVLTAQLAAHTTVADATSREEVACVERRQDQDEATSVKLASPSRLHVQTVFPVQNDEDVVVVPGTPTPEKKSSTPSLPDGWQEFIDEASGRSYYFEVTCLT